MTVTDDEIRKIARDTVTYAVGSIEPVFVYWSKHNKKFSKSVASKLNPATSHKVIGVYDAHAHPHMIEDDLREWIANRPRDEG